jgi:hypothetical protein
MTRPAQTFAEDPNSEEASQRRYKRPTRLGDLFVRNNETPRRGVDRNWVKMQVFVPATLRAQLHEIAADITLRSGQRTQAAQVTRQALRKHVREYFERVGKK